MHVQAALASRVAALEAAFRHIRATRMAGVPVLHPGIRVQAVAFEPEVGAGDTLCGVLITPWFMSLLRLPMQPLVRANPAWLDVGHKALRCVGDTDFEFIGASEQGLGVFETSSLFSPMFGFADHAVALATAQAVLHQLRTPPLPVAAVSAPPVAEPVPSRRGFLFGRGTSAGAL
ncbi:MAG: [NiFe]-hydrogenase assembly chaperone HybE [Vitreoscilla sp.]|nr:[NiFe]-hydrogenase assembly chaperone HybE [Burkholderiales bacterium]MBP6338979.1 [NiFe]-hydrogenase assembly chaperone HybE [Vitreoscilla sp.]